MASIRGRDDENSEINRRKNTPSCLAFGWMGTEM